MRQVLFHPHAFDDLMFFAKNDLKLLRKIVELIQDIRKSPFEGIGKPEPLKFQWKGYWSRRVNDEHRLLYKVTDDYIIIAQCRFHY